MRPADYHDSLHHEAASKILGQRPLSAKYSATATVPLMDFRRMIRFNAVPVS
ncbi:hypothetical protein [Bradyrhizobium sp. STM 3562]|uniref:hypothetical protein n=1 Tax=Bradyrhizobium sp. STM 3562 TaxID=578924 RepID=UPI00388DC762